MMEGRRGRRAPSVHPDGSDLPPTLRSRRRSVFNPASWTPATSSFGPNPGHGRPDGPGVRQFAPTEHLAPEAVAAFVDRELGTTAHARATHHLALCGECAAAVQAQLAARTRLRASGSLGVPVDLLGQLSQIPTREIDMTAARDRPRRDTPAGRGPRGRAGSDPSRIRHSHWWSR